MVLSTFMAKGTFNDTESKSRYKPPTTLRYFPVSIRSSKNKNESLSTLKCRNFQVFRDIMCTTTIGAKNCYMSAQNIYGSYAGDGTTHGSENTASVLIWMQLLNSVALLNMRDWKIFALYLCSMNYL